PIDESLREQLQLSLVQTVGCFPDELVGEVGEDTLDVLLPDGRAHLVELAFDLFAVGLDGEVEDAIEGQQQGDGTGAVEAAAAPVAPPQGEQDDQDAGEREVDLRPALEKPVEHWRPFCCVQRVTSRRGGSAKSQAEAIHTDEG